MKLEHWQIVFKVYRQVRELLDQWLPGALPDTAERTQVQVGREGLNQLQSQLLGAVAQLRAELGTHYRAEEVEEALRPFTYLVDELVLHRLAEIEQVEWPLLQYRLFGEEGGGDLFYELADARLNQPGAPPLIFELLHFCLTAGFTGRYPGNTAKLREYKQRLADRITTPPSAPPATEVPAEARPLLYEFPVRYYAAAGLYLLGLQGLLLWLSH
ncbi:DotU family type IV/VI secretion system protein [Archangium violaceum]|uniref:DotU family type IV/VI secretion system protein n=1 Tax=Archangium violaceum TaxID=83451 RepID=UPI002B2C51B6|nr:DotU family type IV/VI secretion system protein [Archangium gephyra]